MNPDDHVFRAKILIKNRGDEPFVKYEGPYTSAAAAKARVTYWANYMAETDYETGEVSTATWARGEVEFGVVTWSKLDASYWARVDT